MEERLDRALANNLWFNIFSDATVETLVAPASDHYPILINVTPTPRPQYHKRHFLYENAWPLERGLSSLLLTLGRNIPRILLSEAFFMHGRHVCVEKN